MREATNEANMTKQYYPPDGFVVANERGAEPMSKLSKHQKRVLAALLALEQAHAWDWWPREAVGEVVGAGGFHNTIQIKTINILKGKGLVQTQRSSWPEGVRDRVRCNCANSQWGLTATGREQATALNVQWSEGAKKSLTQAAIYTIHWSHDEGEMLR